jgi:hypothetical protein
MHTRRTYLLLFIALFLLGGCRFLPGSQLPTPVAPVTLPPEVDETPILMCTPPACEANEVYFCDGDCPGGCGTTCATVTPAAVTPSPLEETPVLMCTPPACEANEVYFCDGDCPGGCGTTCATVTPAAPGESGAVPADWAGVESWLAAAWRDGMDVATVRAALQAAGWQSAAEQLQTADLNGDQREEWIVALHHPAIAADPSGRVGNLWIAGESGIIYRFYESVGDNVFDSAMPLIVGLNDLSGDGLPEVVVDQHFCGAHTCSGNYQVLGYGDGGIRSLVSRPPVVEGGPGNVIGVTYPDTRFEDATGDGLSDFLVHGGSIGSAGAGIVRTYTEVWAWDGAAVTLAETVLDATEYRHHILYEANDEMSAGNLERALLLYEQAINDTTLQTAVFFPSEEETKGAIDQFAAFRLILIDLLRNDAARAAGRLAWLQSNYPASAAAQGAATLVNGWSGPDGQAALCTQVETTLAALPNPTGALVDLGYGNPSLTAADYCP